MSRTGLAEHTALTRASMRAELRALEEHGSAGVVRVTPLSQPTARDDAQPDLRIR